MSICLGGFLQEVPGTKAPAVFQKVEFTTGEGAESKESGKKVLSGEELSKQLDRLLHDKADDQRIIDWVEVCVRVRARVSAAAPGPSQPSFLPPLRPT